MLTHFFGKGHSFGKTNDHTQRCGAAGRLAIPRKEKGLEPAALAAQFKT
jgi:hypothetical protein